jgi:hypothetical protein
MMTLAGAYHDTGYLTPTSQNFLDGGHPRWSKQYYDAHVRGSIKKALGSSFADQLGEIILTHDGTDMDWSTATSSMTSAFRLADNLALFHFEKLPPLIRYVPANSKVMIDLGEGEIDLGTALDRFRANILAAKLRGPVQWQLMRAAEEVSPITPKLTVGMFGNHIDDIEWNVDHPRIVLHSGHHNQAVEAALGLGYKQFAKLAETYGADPEALVRDLRTDIGSNPTKLELVIEVLRAAAPWLFE